MDPDVLASPPSDSAAPVKRTKPICLKFRSSTPFVTFVVGLGIGVDLLVYGIIIPVIPFRLTSLGYDNVSSKTGWLLFAYSIGLIVSTPPIAIFSERYHLRRWPLLVGIVVLQASQVLFMLAPNYTAMVVARVIQGISSSAIWSVGLALLCDSTRKERVGQQLGLAMSGLSIGLVMGPPIGGALYQHLGYHAPFIFGIIIGAVDFISRLLVVERSDALVWKVDPWTTEVSRTTQVSPASPTTPNEVEGDAEKDVSLQPSTATDVTNPASTSSTPYNPSIQARRGPPLTNWGVLVALCRSRAAMTVFFISFIYGIVMTSQEPTLPLRLYDVWDMNAGRVGTIFIAAVAPTLISGALSGYLTNKIGNKLIVSICLALAAPWYLLLILKSSLALFVTSLAIGSFFIAGVVAPLTAELATVARETGESIGYAHVFGAFNLSYSIGSTVGPIIGGQIFDHVKSGWTVLCIIQATSLIPCVVSAILWIGNRKVEE